MVTLQSPQPAHRLALRGYRFGGYAFWTALATGGPLAIDRLLICPYLNAQFGEEIFGGFVWVRGISLLLGGIITGGFSLFLLRDIATKDEEEIPGILRAAIALTIVVSVLGCAIGGGLSYLVAPKVVRNFAIVLYLPMLCRTMLANTELILAVRLKMKLAFRSLFMLRSIQMVTLLAYIFFALSDNLWMLGGAYVLSAILPLAASFYMNRGVMFQKSTSRDRSAVRWLLDGWKAGTALVTLDCLASYGPQLLIGILAVNAGVLTVFYAGTSISNIFTVPAASLSIVVASLLASKRNFVLHGNRARYYFVGCVVLGLLAGCGSFSLGLWIVQALYPNVAGRTAEFYHWIAIATGLQFFRVMLRPIVIKYVALKTYAVAPAINAFVRLTALAILVPMMGAAGGAIALLISEGITAFVVCLFYRSACRAHAS